MVVDGASQGFVSSKNCCPRGSNWRLSSLKGAGRPTTDIAQVLSLSKARNLSNRFGLVWFDLL